jgi:hypothetical protein
MTDLLNKQDRLVFLVLPLLFSAAHVVSTSVLAGNRHAQPHVVRSQQQKNDAALRNVRLTRQDSNTVTPVLRSNSDRPRPMALRHYLPEASLFDSSSSFGFPLLC